MCRVKSLVGFTRDFKPQLVRQKKGKWDNLSYCFAIVTPNEDEAERYAEELKDNKGHIGKLSDQDHFSHYNRDAYILLHQNIVGFFSWWNHENLMENVIQSVIQLSVDEAPANASKYHWTTMDFAHSLFSKFGCVHSSSAFDVSKIDRTQEEFEEQFLARGNKEWFIPLTYDPQSFEKKVKDKIKVRRSCWARHMCWNLNLLCRKKSMDIVETIYHNIQKYTGAGSPEEGMSKAFFCLASALMRKNDENWRKYKLPKMLHSLDPELNSVKEEYDKRSTPGKAATAAANRTTENTFGPLKKKRRQSGAAASSAGEVVHPWREDCRKRKK